MNEVKFEKGKTVSQVEESTELAPKFDQDGLMVGHAIYNEGSTAISIWGDDLLTDQKFQTLCLQGGNRDGFLFLNGKFVFLGFQAEILAISR